MEEAITPFQRLAGQARKHHEIDMAPTGMAPFSKFLSQGPLLGRQRLGLEVLEALVHQIQGVVDELGRLLGGHGSAREGWTRCNQTTQGKL
jgi:hypothetical protein